MSFLAKIFSDGLQELPRTLDTKDGGDLAEGNEVLVGKSGHPAARASWKALSILRHCPSTARCPAVQALTHFIKMNSQEKPFDNHIDALVLQVCTSLS